jgi:hypothetical protein
LNQLISKGSSLNKFYGNEYSCINSLKTTTTTATTATTTLRKVNSICTAIFTHSMNEETCEPMGGYNQGWGGETTMNDSGNPFTAKDPHHYYQLSQNDVAAPSATW